MNSPSSSSSICSHDSYSSENELESKEKQAYARKKKIRRKRKQPACLKKRYNLEEHRIKFHRRQRRMRIAQNKYLNLSRLSKSYSKLLLIIFKNMIKLQNNPPAALPPFSYKQAETINSDTELINRSEKSSLNESSYNDEFYCTELKSSILVNDPDFDPLDASENLDRFSSIFSNITDEFFNDAANAEKNEICKPACELQSTERQEEFNETNLQSIKTELVQLWTSMSQDEKNGIIDLITSWQVSVNRNYEKIKDWATASNNSNKIRLNYEIVNIRGDLDFENTRNSLKNAQMLILAGSKSEKRDKIRSNSRLIIRCFDEFVNAFDSLEQARKNRIDSNFRLFWQDLNKCICHLSKAVLRGAFLVHEIANLNDPSHCLLPIYLLESNDNMNKELKVNLETIQRYIFICLNTLAENRAFVKEGQSTKKLVTLKKMKGYRKILNSLMRVVHISFLIREDLMLKTTTKQASTIDWYSHLIANESSLLARLF
jgi:hypothetical protein